MVRRESIIGAEDRAKKNPTAKWGLLGYFLSKRLPLGRFPFAPGTLTCLDWRVAQIPFIELAEDVLSRFADFFWQTLPVDAFDLSFQEILGSDLVFTCAACASLSQSRTSWSDFTIRL